MVEVKHNSTSFVKEYLYLNFSIAAILKFIALCTTYKSSGFWVEVRLYFRLSDTGDIVKIAKYVIIREEKTLYSF